MQFIFSTMHTPEHARLDEAWGTAARIECEKEELRLNESTTCKVSFTAEPEAIADSYWYVNRTFTVAAWPGQR